MFESLTDRFEGIFTKLRGKGKLSEADVDEVLREIRLALLEADVNLSVVKTLQGRIRERAVGEELSGALNPAQQVVKIVNEELTATLGGEAIRISFASKPPTVVLMAGLQGSGKTTNSAKLARWFKACLLYTSPSPRDRTRSRMPSSACKKKTTNHSQHNHILIRIKEPIVNKNSNYKDNRKTQKNSTRLET